MANVSNTYCKVLKCRFPQYHVTMGHKCGKCHRYSHGSIECGNHVYKTNLASSLQDILPENLWCKFGGCVYHKLHTTEGHHCSKCDGRLHSMATCPTNPTNLIDPVIEIKCPICKQDNRVNKNQQKIFGLNDTCVVCLNDNVEIFFPTCGHVCVCYKCFKKLTNFHTLDVFNDIRDESILLKQKYDLDKIKTQLKEYPSYIIVYENMGCYSIIRRLNPRSELEGLFNHSDDGYIPEKTKQLDDFINGYCMVNTSEYLIHDWIGGNQ